MSKDLKINESFNGNIRLKESSYETGIISIEKSEKGTEFHSSLMFFFQTTEVFIINYISFVTLPRVYNTSIIMYSLNDQEAGQYREL